MSVSIFTSFLARRRFIVSLAATVITLGALYACSSVLTLDESGSLLAEDITKGDSTATAVPGSKDANPICQVSYQASVRLGNGTLLVSDSVTALYAGLGADQVIDGLEKGFRGETDQTSSPGPMRVGGSRKITIPPRYGYGIQQVGSIPPNSTLIFSIKRLLSVEPFLIEQLQRGDSTGTGAEFGKTLSVYYRGTLKDGRPFDSVDSTKSSPFQFVLGSTGIISGWNMGLKGVKVGERRKLTIPSVFAYGSQSVGIIPANATLIFEITVKSIQ